MTTKELFHRLQAFSSLNLACRLFYSGSDVVRDFIYSVQFCWHGRKSLMYVITPFACFGESFIPECDYLYFDRFTRDQFKSQVKFFISFYNRCSQRQKDIVRSSGQVVDLLYFLNEGSE